MKFSVLLSVYKKESPLFLKQSFDSLKEQTLQPNEIVLVEDGKLTKELNLYIEVLSKEIPNLKIISYEKNMGLGYALAKGISHCKYDLIARMDTDDICKPYRFEKEIKYFEQHPDTDVVGSWIEEFIDTPSNVCSIRKVPKTNSEIMKFAKYRNPMNHPTVMFKKASVLKAGNYRSFFYFEDYYLWIRMLQNGAKFYNFQESLLYFRQSKDMYNRRGGKDYIHTEYKFYKFLYTTKFIGLCCFVKNIYLRTLVRLLPNEIRSYIYNKGLRKKI